MSIVALELDGHPGHTFTAIVRELPDGASWFLSDPDGAVIIARSEGEEMLREAILVPVDGAPGSFEVECMASRGVSEAAVQGLVALAGAASIFGVLGVWLFGPGGLWGLILGICVAGSFPVFVLAIGQRLIDPGRDRAAEAQLERALRFAAAHVRGASVRDA